MVLKCGKHARKSQWPIDVKRLWIHVVDDKK
jgi:hypothetical protein